MLNALLPSHCHWKALTWLTVLLFVAIMETTPLVVIIPPSRAVAALGFTIYDASRPSQVDAEKVTSDEDLKGAYMFFYVKRD